MSYPVRLGIKRAGGWSDADLVGWWIADQGFVYTDTAGTTEANNNDPVGKVKGNGKGGGKDLTAGGDDTTRPTKKEGKQNGKNAISFDGVDDYLYTTDLVLAQPYTVVLVTEIVQSQDGDLILDGTSAGGTLFNDGGYLAMTAGGGTITDGLLEPGFYTIVMNVDGANSSLIVNGTEYTGDVGTGDPVELTFGSGSAMDLYEILIFDAVQSPSNTQAVLDYLDAKYVPTAYELPILNQLLWEIVAEDTIASAGDSFDFNSLDLSAYQVIKIELQGAINHTALGTMKTYFNGDTTDTNYRSQYFYSVGLSSGVGHSDGPNINLIYPTYAGADDGYFEGYIFNPGATEYKQLFWHAPIYSNRHEDRQHYWEASTDPITRIQFVGLTYGFTAGSNCRILGLKEVAQ